MPIKVFDELAKEVTTLINSDQNQGVSELKFDGSKLSSGTYFF
ncbi:MAG: hypothetical protein OQJ81_09920 [Melioribacteraceae bacterium]|nr:hypothetical protein [Melioribacteraceae bacterium]